MTIREFYCGDVCPNFKRVDVDVSGYGNYRIAKSIAPMTADRYEVICWNGDVKVVPGYVTVTDWRN